MTAVKCLYTYLHYVGNIRIAFCGSGCHFQFFFFQIELKGLRVLPFNIDTLLIVFFSEYFTACFGAWTMDNVLLYRARAFVPFSRDLDNTLYAPMAFPSFEKH